MIQVKDITREQFLLARLVNLYKEIELSGDDYIRAFRFLGELEDAESELLALGVSRAQICCFVNNYFKVPEL